MEPVYGPFLSRAEAKRRGLKWYFVAKHCPRGHVAMRQVANSGCRECQLLTNAANCKQWYENKGRDRVLAAAREWVKKNPQRRREISSRYSQRWRQTPAYQEWLEARKTPDGRAARREYARKQRAEDPQAMLKNRLRSRIRAALLSQYGHKAVKTIDLIGCSYETVKQHIESLFTDGMGWHNYGEWHIDHIIPCSSFDLTKEDQQKECFNYKNLQPLWAADNFKKSNKINT